MKPWKRICAVAAAAWMVGACAAEIGDACQFDVDCSPNMNRNCDRSQPGGYCLIIGCTPDECPSESVCVEYTTPCPTGTEPEVCERIEPQRKRPYCLKDCKNNSDCRGNYRCASPGEVYGQVIDPGEQDTKVCIPDV